MTNKETKVNGPYWIVDREGEWVPEGPITTYEEAQTMKFLFECESPMGIELTILDDATIKSIYTYMDEDPYSDYMEEYSWCEGL